MNFGLPNVEIGQKMANAQLLFLALELNTQNERLASLSADI